MVQRAYGEGMWMMDPDLKKKIVNTISRYEQKCSKLQTEIDCLKSTVQHLAGLPVGIHVDLDKQLTDIQQEIKGKFDPQILEKKVQLLNGLMAKVGRKKTDNISLFNTLLIQSLDSVGRIAQGARQKQELAKLRHMVEEEADITKIVSQFHACLNQIISSVMKQLEVQEEQAPGGKDEPDSVSVQVNESLQHLLNHLSIPPELNEKVGTVKIELERVLSVPALSKVIDELTSLVIEAFNIEQARFKGFLHKLTDQLNDFNHYLTSTVDYNKTAAMDSLRLEDDIKSDITQIRIHLDSSKSLEELTVKVGQELESIEGRMRAFREKQDKRLDEYQLQVSELQTRLAQSEEDAEEIKNLLSVQKYRINHDGLTGIPNRESYDEHILDAYNRWQRSEGTLCLVIGDIDYFKRINDTYGHLAGDKVLKKIALIFKASIRAVDFVARFGGEEFVFIFEQTAKEDVALIIEKIRKAIEETQFCYREEKVDVTCSFGITEILSGEDVESFFARADKALYNAKNAGRNRVEIL